MSTTTSLLSKQEIMEFDTLLARLGQRDRVAFEKHVAACEAETSPSHARVWKRLACLLAQLASSPVQPEEKRASQTVRQFGVETSGQRAVKFFAPDGKYRRQVFALEDLKDGSLVVYAVDALDAAKKAGAVHGPISGPVGDRRAGVYRLGERGAEGVSVSIEFLTADNCTGAPDYYRHMFGWNRTALRVILPVEFNEEGLPALGVLFGLAARGATGKQ